MATAVSGSCRPAAPGEFCGSGKLRHLGGSDVVLTKQRNTCKHRDYVGQASRRYRFRDESSPLTAKLMLTRVRAAEPLPKR